MHPLHRSIIVGTILLFCARPTVLAHQNPASTHSAPVLITALHAYGEEGERDEALRLTNMTNEAIRMGEGWWLRDDRNRAFEISPTITLEPAKHVWLAHQTDAFVRRFGFSPTLEYGSAPSFPDSGGHVRLITETSALRDIANREGGAWPAPPSSSHNYRSMERRDPGAGDAPSNWAAAATASPWTLDSAGNPILGTPGSANSVRVSSQSITTSSVVINELAWAGTRASGNHEWLELYNNQPVTVSLLGWMIYITSTNSSASVALTGSIGPNGFYVLARNADTFGRTLRPDQTASALAFSNSGAVVALMESQETLIDSVAWGNGSAAGWTGEGVRPYTITGTFRADGQLLLRKTPFIDTDRASDWINPRKDGLDDGKPVFANWHEYETFATPVRAQSHVTVAVAPDASFAVLRDFINSAHSSIDAEAYTFDNFAIAELLRARIEAGVRVRLLLDGDPVGGLADQNKWVCQRISEANSESGCWFMRSINGNHYYEDFRRRYENLHSKIMIVDGRQVMVSSENLGGHGFPADDLSDGTQGHRGMLVILDGAALVARAQAFFDADFSPSFNDIGRWSAGDPRRGLPVEGFVPVTMTGGIGYLPRFTEPLILAQPITVELASSPESHLSRSHGLIALLENLGEGDEILAEQLNEPHYWGAESSNPFNDPNPRMAGVIAAASRGATVTLMLDSYYPSDKDKRGNYKTKLYITEKFSDTKGRVSAVMANPTKVGIHNKLYLIHRKQGGYTQIGSWNGNETSAKLNREVSALLESDEIYEYVKKVVVADVRLSQPVHLPLAMSGFSAPQSLTYPLISEVMFSPIGLDDGNEWVELYNASDSPLNLTGFKIGDAETPGRSTSDGMHRFPDGYVMPARKVLVIAQDAGRLRSSYGITADFELINSAVGVPLLAPYTAWSSGAMQLGNSEDQVILLDPQDHVVDVLQWGRELIAGCSPYTATVQSGHTLQRFPPNKDTNNCAADFRDSPFNTPGRAP